MAYTPKLTYQASSSPVLYISKMAKGFGWSINIALNLGVLSQKACLNFTKSYLLLEL